MPDTVPRATVTAVDLKQQQQQNEDNMICHFALLSGFKTPGYYTCSVIAEGDGYWQSEQVTISITFYILMTFRNFLQRC